MSHEISIVNGRAEMFSGNQVVPWHKLGTVVSGLLTASEAIVAAHLGWTVQLRPITVEGKILDQKAWQATVRMDTQDTLGIVRGQYEVIQNAECFSFMDSLVADGKIKYETAGALRDGKQVWLLAKYDGDMPINGDKTEQWLLLITSHDGSKCLELAWVSVRVVCANTLSLALKGKSNSIKIRHASNWESKRAEAIRVLGLTQDYFAQLQEGLSKLHDTPMSQPDMEAFTKLLYPAKDEKEVPTRTSNMRWGVERLFNRPAVGTYGQSRFDALNAVSDWADHYSTLRGNNSTRLESSLLASGAELKQKAYDLLTAEDFTARLIAAKPFIPTPATPVSDNLLPVSDDFSRLINGN